MSANFDQLDDEMADPTKYTPGYSFSDYQASNPADPLPADEVDTELAAISNSVDQVVEAIRNVRRSDGALKNLIVTYDSLSADMKARLAAVGFDGTEEDIDEIIAGVEGVTAEQIQKLAQDRYTADQCALLVLGPKNGTTLESVPL